eukprot:TRINITY_DN1210_c0_g1_i10.p1 TRINITY_DN1210_c0_g1~~TRINITY_DN1210_c0_g1_i10.p1  ORF type:complete len:436 (-),score=71.06 TRINITY_DN1210_c0_g1_i10:255-1562(-)
MDILKEGDNVANGSIVLHAPEAEAYVEQLQPLSVTDVADPRWIRQHEFLEKLNIQAHLNAATRGDEYVMEAFITFQKFPVLIQDLISIELWKENIYPLLKEDLAKNTVRAYSVLYHEAVVANLLEISLFHEQACASVGDAIIDLADWCYRKLMKLHIEDPKNYTPKKKTADEIMKVSPEQQLEEQRKSIEFGVAMSAISILRYLTDHLSRIPIGVTTRLLVSNDIIALLVPLLLQAPWTHRSAGAVHKWVDNKWTSIAKTDQLRVIQVEAQVWLSLFNLLLGKEGYSKYEMNTHRKTTILQLRSLVSEILIDQIPPLLEMKRYLEELSLMNVQPPSRSPFILEQVPEIYDSMSSHNWQLLAQSQRPRFDVSKEEERSDLKRLAEVYHLSNLEDLMEPPKCAKCGILAAQRCSRCHLECNIVDMNGPETLKMNHYC